MGSSRKLNRGFGKPGGYHSNARRKLHSGRVRHKFRVISGNTISNSSDTVAKRLTLKICCQRILKSYKVNTKRYSLLKKDKDKIFSVCKVSSTDFNSCKLKISKVRDVSGYGYRFINLQKLQSHVMEITIHASLCEKAIDVASAGKPPIKLISEIRQYGLASVLMAECQGCLRKFEFDTSPKLNNNCRRYDVNVRAVWGSIVTGNGAAHMNEFLGTMDSPGLTQSTFTSIEEQIGEWWRTVLETEMLTAGAAERQIAIDKGHFFREVPSITVITDGGWCKRTHKHSYNALGGVAIIIGKETGKLLHIGVRNKYCYICNRAESQHITPKEHTCFRNWNDSSQAMEADIIIEGFKQAEDKHGLRYMTVIGDGDSSVYAKIRQEVPGWGPHVKKLECANHVCKCLRSNLEKVVSENPQYKGKHHLSKSARIRIVSAVRCSIRMRSAEAKENRSAAAKKLRADIMNSVHHVFGYHENCSNFCKAKQQSSSEIPSEDNPTSKYPKSNINTDEDIETVSDVMNSQIDMWTEGISVQDQEESRHASSISYANVEKFILQDVSAILSRIAEKSDRLLGNLTTNLAECWMHVRSKFDGGKLYNICSRGSWHGRCYGGALRTNLGPQWSPQVWQTVTTTKPGKYFTQLYTRRERQLKHSTTYKSKPETHIKRWKRKMVNTQQSNSKKAKLSYGPEALDVTEDDTPEQLEKHKHDFIKKNIDIENNKIIAIEKATKQQSESGLWHTERKKRLTASTFASVVKRNPALAVAPLIKRLLYSNFKGNRHTRNGLQQERITIQEYILKKAESNENVSVEQMGLVIDRTHKYLAASPDGKVASTNGESGLIEIKNLVHNIPLNLRQAAETVKNFCLEIKGKKLQLKKSHPYFYQCQGLLHICDCKWIDFVVRTINPYQLHIERIYRDKDLWASSFFPKLTSFYQKVLLPELASPREGKIPGIREPGIWVCHDDWL